MLYNYLTVTLRNIKKYRLYAFINIFGLAVSIACFTLLFLLIRHEVTYDKFHQNYKNIYRITEIIDKYGIGEHAASVPFPVANTLQRLYPQDVVKTVRLFNYQSPSLTIAYKDLYINEKHFFFADSTFFEVFNFDLKLGNKQTALQAPNQVVISETVATKYFGIENPIGKKLLFQNERELEITGVFAELPTNTHLHFDFIASFSSLHSSYINRFYTTWRWNPCWTYIVVAPHINTQDLLSAFNRQVKTYLDADLQPITTFTAQPLTDIHLYSNLDYEMDTNGNITYIYIFSVIAVFILIIAGINFMNLSTAKSSIRAKEVVVRKVLGASRQELVVQFLFESFIFSIFSIFIAFILIETFTPHLTDLSGKPLPEGFVHGKAMVVSIILSGLLVGLVAGIYPAYCLAAYNPMEVFRGRLQLNYGGKWFRRIAVMVQFVIAGILLITTLVSQEQLDYMKNSRLGFDKEKILVLSVAQEDVIIENYKNFKRSLLSNPMIASVTSMELVLGAGHQTHRFQAENSPTPLYYPSLRVRHDFIKTFNIELLAGRDFSELPQIEQKNYVVRDSITKSKKNDETSSVIINEAMLKHLGYKTPQEALGKQLKSPSGQEKIVGVVKNFHVASLHTDVMPFVLDMPNNYYEELMSTKYIAVKISSNDEEKVKNFIEETWKKYTPAPLEISLLNDNLNSQYHQEEKLSEIAQFFSLIAIFIACMGLFGLSSFVIENRYHEIGIRKAVGASVLQIVLLLSQNFVVTVLFSWLIASLMGYVGMNLWLREFSYHINISVLPFFATAFIMLGVTVLTISYQTIKAALKNPVDIIRKK